MATWIRFTILYLIPIITFVISFMVYLHAYGKPPKETYIAITFQFVVVGLVVSSIMAAKLVNYFLLNQNTFWGISFSLIAWLMQLAIFIIFILMMRPYQF